MPRIIEGKEMNLIGDRLRVLRKKHHLSQQQLSERLETQAVYICRGSISRIEDKSRTVTDTNGTCKSTWRKNSGFV